MYSKAIELNPNESIYFSNRAMVYKKLNKYKEAKNDCIQAIEINNQNIKALLLYGQILCQTGKMDKSCKQLEKGIRNMEKALKVA